MTDVATFTPSLLDAAEDSADVYADGCHQDQVSGEVLSCSYGDASSSTTVALVGDSHAAHWQPALRVLAEDRGWRLETATKSSCPYADTDVWLPELGAYESCREWQAAVTDTLLAGDVDLVVVSADGGYRTVRDGRPTSRADSQAELSAALAASWNRLIEAGIDVLVINDTPAWEMDVPDCVAQHEPDLTECTVPRAQATAASGAALLEAAHEQAPEAELVDLTDHVCPGTTCVPVIGDVLVYSDSHHLTATYARTLAPQLGLAYPLSVM